MPALLVWGSCWLVFALGMRLGVPAWPALAFAAAVGLGSSRLGATTWRRLCIGAGFPLSFAAAAGALPAWAWLLPLLALVLLYPPRAWRDAPMFPTPAGALRGLAARLPLADGTQVLDAGCGLGDGLRELHREYPNARLAGIEFSRPLRLVCAWRCRYAQVSRGDLWAADWRDAGLVYLFQRPESMVRAVAKAERELQRGAWLASLEFEAVGLRPQHVHQAAGGKPVWLYRAPFVRR